MIPNNNINEGLTPDFEEVVGPTKNYRLVEEAERIVGYTDGIEAMKQAYYLILSTERYEHEIYSWNAGIQLVDLFGKPVHYVVSEVKKRIREALMQDDRTLSVNNFDVTINKNSITVRYLVTTIFGEVDGEKEVMF